MASGIIDTENGNTGFEPATADDLRATRGRILGVDFGDVRTGLALSDESRFLASGIGYVSPGGLKKTAEAVARVALEKKVGAIVVGLPVNMNGTEGPRALRAREFAAELYASVVGLGGEKLPIHLSDERMTTMAASRFLNETNTRGTKRRGVIDTLSAQIILQNLLDRIGQGSGFAKS